jgi:hypothetical protein
VLDLPLSTLRKEISVNCIISKDCKTIVVNDGNPIEVTRIAEGKCIDCHGSTVIVDFGYDGHLSVRDCDCTRHTVKFAH